VIVGGGHFVSPLMGKLQFNVFLGEVVLASVITQKRP
jgi:hypothetical protein